MKVQVKIIEEKILEVDLTPEEYCCLHACGDYEIRDKILSQGKLVDLSRTWEDLINLEPDELEKFFDSRG